MQKMPNFVFNISPGLDVISAYITKDNISPDESVFSTGQIALIEKILNTEIANIENNYLNKLEAEKKIAWQNGNQAGLKQAQNQMLSQVQILTEQMKSMLNSLSIQAESIIEYHEQEILKLVIKIARKIIDTEVSLNPEIVLNVLKNSLNFLNEKEEIKVLVNSNDWTIVKDNLKKLSLTIDLPENIEIISNPNIAQGGCRIDFKAGSIDADLETQFAEIQRKLLKNV